MALPADFSKIYGSTATGGLAPISDVNYAKGWEFVGGNPPTKNDFSYLQNLSDLKSQWLYSNKLQRTDPFGDIKSDGTVNQALENLSLGASAFGLQNCIVFNTAGVTNWAVPDELKNGRKCKVTVIGGGGSGGRSAGGGGGGGGGKAVKFVDLTGISSVPVTVGAGGAGLASGTTQISGNTGQSSSFGTYLSATGGGAGGVVSGGAPGVGSGGDDNTSLGPGNPGVTWGNLYCGGSGGGPGGAGISNDTNRNGANSVGPGGGGAGAAWGATVAAATSGAGFNGLVIVEW